MSPLTTVGAPPFWFTQITVFGTLLNGKTTTTMMVKGVTAFKHNFPLKFSRFVAKLLATNCCT